MPLFGKSHKKDDPFVDNTTTGRHDPKFSGSGTDPNSMGYDQPGANNDLGVGSNPPQQRPYSNEANYTGADSLSHHSKPSRFGGKVETAIGTMVGSDSLRAKGMEKEREARNLNMQSSELAQAESLEREAQMHRDRAMGGGNRNLMDNNADRRF